MVLLSNDQGTTTNVTDLTESGINWSIQFDVSLLTIVHAGYP